MSPAEHTEGLERRGTQLLQCYRAKMEDLERRGTQMLQCYRAKMEDL